MTEPELEAFIDRKFTSLQSSIDKAANEREKEAMKTAFAAEKRTDCVEKDVTELCKQAQIIFGYIDEMKSLTPKVDATLAKLDEVLDVVKSHENRIREIEVGKATYANHEEKTADQEKRLRWLEKVCYIGIGMNAAISIGLEIYGAVKG